MDPLRARGDAPSEWLQTLLAPTDSAMFLERFYEREPLHLLADDTRPIPELATHERDALVSASLSLAVRAEAVSDGHKVEVLKAGASVQDLDPEAGRRALALGHTVRMLGVQHALSGLAAFCRRLETALEARVNANAYATPAEVPGVGAHYDTHDVLVWQIQGSKHWACYVPQDPAHGAFLPMPSETGRKLDVSRMRKRTMTLEVNDLLYIPRGTAHATVGGGEGSTHITFGIQPVRWRDVFVEQILSTMDDDPFFRHAARVADWPAFQARADRLLEEARKMRDEPGIIAKLVDEAKARASAL